MHSAVLRDIAQLFALKTVAAAHNVTEKVSFYTFSTLGCVQQ